MNQNTERERMIIQAISLIRNPVCTNDQAYDIIDALLHRSYQQAAHDVVQQYTRASVQIANSVLGQEPEMEKKPVDPSLN